MCPNKLTFSVFYILFYLSSIGAQESGLVVSGELLNDLTCLQNFDKRIKNKLDFSGYSTLTLNARNRQANMVRVDASVDFTLFYGAGADQALSSTNSPLLKIVKTDGAALIDVRKLYGSIISPHFTASLGRQIINFGQGLVFSPINVFSTINILDLNFKRSGSNVARCMISFNDLSGLDLIAKLTSRKQGATAAMKLYTHISSFDVNFINLYHKPFNRIITGVTFKGDAIVGLYGELVEHWYLDVGESFTGMLGMDYSIENTFFFTVEYLYNQKPSPALSLSDSLTADNTFAANKQFGFFSARYQINELMAVSGTVLTAIKRNAALLTVNYQYEVLQNADMNIYVQYLAKEVKKSIPALQSDMRYGLRLAIAF